MSTATDDITRFVFPRYKYKTGLASYIDKQLLLRSRFLWLTRNMMAMTCHITNLVDVRRMLKTAKICQWTDETTKESARRTLSVMQKFEDADKDPGFVYILKAGDYYKIGKTSKLSSRIKTISLQMPFKIEVFAIIPSLNYGRLENLLHTVFHSKNTNGEWFCLSDSDLEKIYGFESIFTFNRDIEQLLSGCYRHIATDMQRIIQDDR